MRAPLANFRNARFWVMAGSDTLLFCLSLWVSYLLRFDFDPPGNYRVQVLGLLKYALAFKLGFYYLFGLYRGMWRYTSVGDFWRLARVSALASAALVAFVLYHFGFVGFPRSVFVFDWVLTLVLTGGLRLFIRAFYTWRSAGTLAGPAVAAPRRRVLVIGAGRAGENILREIAGNPRLNCQVAGFLDDDPAKRGRAVHDRPVLGSVSELAAVAAREEVDEIFIAVSRATPEEMRRIMETCKASGLPYKILPALAEIMDGRVGLKTLRDVDYLDLLGRSEIRLDEEGIRAMLAGRCVLVTGCGGSIGSELVRQIVRFAPARIVLVDLSEYNLYRIQTELNWELGFTDNVPVLGSVADAGLMARVFAEQRPSVVFHAAAYKHVPMMEGNPWQAVANNVVGTRTVMRAAVDAGVERFVIVSTDKAVRPTNVMGASKRVTELLMTCFAGGPTRFMAVRFGNVVGSSGSVIPLFRRQIERGGPVTVTHPEVTRYFMSIAEATQLILQAGAMGRGGEVFVLDMGVPVKIADMARDLIRLSGKEPGVDVDIVFTGLRPGEKLYEELITSGEGILRTEHEKILVLGPTAGACPGPGGIEEGVELLARAASRHDAGAIRELLARLVPEFAPAENDGPTP